MLNYDKIIAILVNYAKTNNWEVTEIRFKEYKAKTTNDGRLELTAYNDNGELIDYTRYTCKSTLDSIDDPLCGMTVLERKIEQILYYFYTSVDSNMIKKYV